MRHRPTEPLAILVLIAAAGCAPDDGRQELIARVRQPLAVLDRTAERARWTIEPVDLSGLFGDMVAAGPQVPSEPSLGSGGPGAEPQPGEGGPAPLPTGGPGAPTQPSGGPAPGPTVSSGATLGLAAAVCDFYAALCQYLERCASQASGQGVDLGCEPVFLSGTCEGQVAQEVTGTPPEWAAGFVSCLASAIRGLSCQADEVDPIDFAECLPPELDLGG